MNLKLSRTLTSTSSLSKSKSSRKKVLTAFTKSAGIRFRNWELLELSLMHRSASNESGLKVNNERLEFLGDAVLGTVAATLLYENFAEKPEGELAKIKSVIVSEDVLSGVALEFQIDNLLILGKGEENSGGRSKKAILADAMEALIGALYLDSGFDAAFSFVSKFLKKEINRVLEDRHHKDYKSILQEYSQKQFKSYPVYHLTKRSGPEHARVFWIEVTVDNKTYGPGTGRNKKSAEQEAARLAWEKLTNEK